jgi:hypothetical protein
MRVKHPRFEPGSLGQRILFCRAVQLSDLFVSDGRMSQTDFGIAIAHRLNRERPFPAATVSRWESDLATPDLTTIGAIASSAKVDPGWLAFGAASNAPTPIDDMPEHERLYALAYLKLARQDLELTTKVSVLRKQEREALREQLRKVQARIIDARKASRRK